MSKLHRFKDVEGFSNKTGADRKIAEYINGRNFYMESGDYAGISHIKFEDSDGWVYAGNVVTGYDTFFTELEVEKYLEEVPEDEEPSQEYFVIVRDEIGNVTAVSVKPNLDEAKKEAASRLSDKTTVVIAKTFLSAEKEVVFK